jgi:hypothetical protein
MSWDEETRYERNRVTLDIGVKENNGVTLSKSRTEGTRVRN